MYVISHENSSGVKNKWPNIAESYVPESECMKKLATKDTRMQPRFSVLDR